MAYIDTLNLTGTNAHLPVAPLEVRTIAHNLGQVPHFILDDMRTGNERLVIDQITATSIRVRNPSATEVNGSFLLLWFVHSVSGSLTAPYPTTLLHMGGSTGLSPDHWLDPVISRLDTPPGGPTDGDRYIVTAIAGGAWVGHEDDIAEWEATSASWVFETPNSGDAVIVDTEQSVYVYQLGGGWKLTVPLLHDLGSSTRHSSTGQVAGEYVEADGVGGVRWKESLGFIYPGNTILSVPFVVENGKTVRIEGNLSIGTIGTPIINDVVCLTVRAGGRLIVEGNLSVYRNVAAATRLIDIGEGAEVVVEGSMTTVHSGGGANEGVVVHDKSDLYVKGATSITSDCADAAWAVGLYAYTGWNRLTFVGGLTIIMNSLGKHWPVYVSRSDVMIGDEWNLTGSFVVTDSSNTGQADGVVAVLGGRFRVYGTTTITANALVTEPGFVGSADCVVALYGNLTIAMAAQTAGKILWAAHCIKLQCSIASITCGALAAQAIRIENGAVVELGTCTIAGNGGTLYVCEGCRVHVSGALSLGTVGSPSTRDMVSLAICGGASMICDAGLSVYRTVVATTDTVLVQDSELKGASTCLVGGSPTGQPAIRAKRSQIVFAGACTFPIQDYGVAPTAGIVVADQESHVAFEGAVTGKNTNVGASQPLVLRKGSKADVSQTAGYALQDNAGAETCYLGSLGAAAVPVAGATLNDLPVAPTGAEELCRISAV